MAQAKQDMGSGSVKKLMLQLMIPAVVAQVVNLLYNIVDRIYIGHIEGIGAAALTGVGLFTPILMLLNAFAMLVGAGGAPRTAIALGQGDRQQAEKIISNSFTMLLLFSVVLTISFYAGAPMLLRLFGASDATLPYALSYSRIYILGSVFVLLVLGMNPFITTQGFAKTSMLTTVIGAVINIILDPILIFGFGLGVRGAAIATVLAQGISAVLGVVYILRGYPELRFTPRQLGAATRRAVTSMFWAGLSMGLMSAIYNLGSVALQSSINALGSVYITAQTAARRLAELYFIPGGALGIGVATFSSQNLGAGRRSRIWQSVKAALAIYFVWWVFVMAFTFLLGGAAIRGITGSTDEVIISNALLYLKISAPVIPPMAVLVILRNMLQGIRHTVEPLLASGLELVGKVIFAVWLVPIRGYRAVCFCEPTTWVVCFVFILLAVWRCRGDLRDAEKI